MRHAIALFVSCTIVVACGTKAQKVASSPCDAQPNQVLTVPNAPYGSDQTFNSLDLYLPWHKAGEPLILFVHGGGWISGDKRDYRHMGNFFARCGIAFASVNYPLSPRVRADAQAAAVLAAMHWLSEHAPVYGYAGDRVFLMGHSAGAELVALAALDPALARIKDPGPIAGVIAIAGLGYRPPSHAAAAVLAPNIRNYYRAAFGPDEELWQRFNVERALRGREREREPAFLIVHGSDDTYVPEADSHGLARALNDAGDAVAYLQPADRDHATVLSSIARDPNDPTGLAIEHFVFSGSTRP